MTGKYIRSAAAALVLAIVFAGTPALAADFKLPQTAEDHLAMAKDYDAKATAWRGEAAYHRQMAAAYKRANPDFKGIPNSEAVKMEKHCMAIVKDMDKAATEAEESAKYHRLRAKELQGQ